MAPNVHTPAKKPAVAPQAVSVFGSAKNAARLADAINEKMKANPNILRGLAPF